MTQIRRLAASWHPLTSITYSALFLLLLWTVLQRFITGQDDPNRCRALLTDGTWSPVGNGQHDAQKWEPNGCRMVEYSTDAVHDCLSGRKFVLAGDSTIRQIFWAAARKLDPQLAAAELQEVIAADEKHQDLTFNAEGVSLEFIWDPWLNSSLLRNTLDAFRIQPSSTQGTTLIKRQEESPALIVLGSPGLWAARYGGNDYMTLFKDGIDTVSTYLSLASQGGVMGSSSLSTSPNWNQGYNSAPNHILLTPVQTPAYSALSNKRTETITPERIDEMNDYLSQLPLNQTSHVVWAFNRMVEESSKSFGADGLHVEDDIADRKIDIVLNSHCNNPAVLHDRSFQGTCCVEEPSNYVFNVVLVLLCVVMLCTPRAQSMPKSIRPELLAAVRDMLAMLAWCWICDGTLQFSKVERHYRQGAFVAICLFWLVGSSSVLHKIAESVGESSWSAKDAKKDSSSSSSNEVHKFLSRDQTDEIKGLMQGIILLYHFDYASQALWVYKIVRVLISMYFFLSAYGHTLYLLKTGDYSFKRLAAVLFRTNALSALLPFIMGTNYSSYYFASAVTFYYLVIYLMLRTLKESNSDPWPLAMKVLVTAGFTSMCITTPGFLEAATNILHTVFRMSFDVQELRFRLALDRYIVFVGVMVASLVHTANTTDAQEVFTSKGSPRLFSSGRPRFWVICSVGLALFLLVTQLGLSTKPSYNAAHPYISWIPVLAVITLRNLYAPAQNFFLAIPAALGRISLETYILQYHIWLGGDATARLTLGGFENASFPLFLLEKALITTLFIGMAALTHRATRTLTSGLSEVGFLVFLAALWAGNLIYT